MQFMDQSDDDEYGPEEGIEEVQQDDSLCKFTNHGDSVYCVDIYPIKPHNIFVSGDGKDKAYVWQIYEVQQQAAEEKTE